VSDELVLEMRGIRKEFPGVVANDDVSLDVRRGEVHALLGENGAGKSTLMNILYGLSSPDAGEIRLHGKPVSFGSASDAIEAGIGMVHQHFMLIPVMTVAENVVLGTEPVKDGVLLDEASAERRVADMAKTFNFAVDPAALVRDIGVGQQQRVEIMKALYRNADILILDEPTAVLTPQEALDLFEILRSLRREGISIVFITHKLGEVLEIADRITVLRRGKTIETVPREGATEKSLARAMVGRDVLLRVEKQPAQAGDVLLEVEDLWVSDDRGIEKVRGVSLQVHAGEIVGIAGVDGNGQTELIEALTGLRRADRGVIRVGGRELHHASTRDVLDAGLGHIPEDRQRRGLVLEFSLAENIALHDYAGPPDSKWGWLFPGRLIERARSLIEEFDVRGARVLIAAQPTRGLDVGAIEYLHRRLVAERDEGRAILLVSLELDEIFSLSDRILVLYEGEIVGRHEGKVSEEQIGFEMVGVQPEVPA
jgi:general nucleoside transport system ATP-binding protein